MGDTIGKLVSSKLIKCYPTDGIFCFPMGELMHDSIRYRILSSVGDATLVSENPELYGKLAGLKHFVHWFFKW